MPQLRAIPTLRAVADLVLPNHCPACSRSLPSVRPGLCPVCLLTVETRMPFPTVPEPPPPDMPACHAGGPYAGTLRDVLLAYKERARLETRTPLADLLARTVRALTPTRAPLLVPVPSTYAARRRRSGDHLLPLAAEAAARLGGRILPCLRARHRPDSVGQDRATRLRTAADAYAPSLIRRRPPPGTSVVLVDDIVTSGATLAAVARTLTDLRLNVIGAAVVAAAVRVPDLLEAVRANSPDPGLPGRNLWLHETDVESDSRRPTGDTQVISG